MMKKKYLSLLVVFTLMIALLPNASYAAEGNPITLTNMQGSTTGSVSKGSFTTHQINTDIPANKVVVVSFSGQTTENSCSFDLINQTTRASVTRESHYVGPWSRMTYFITSDSTNKRYYVRVNGGSSLSYTINVYVVDKTTFSKMDSTIYTSSSSNDYIISNAPEVLNSNNHKGEWGYYLQRSKINGNANIFWEHVNGFTNSMKFGVLLWNKESYPITVTLNRRSAKSVKSSGNTTQSAVCGVWADWFNVVKQQDELNDNFETTPITIPAYDPANPSASAKWIFMKTVESYYPQSTTYGLFNGVMSISLKKSDGSKYTGTNLYCDTYIMTPGYEDQVIPAIANMNRASTTDQLRGSGSGPVLHATISGTTTITSSTPYRLLLGGYSAPYIQSGELIPITDYTKTGSATTLPNCYNFGVVYKITVSNFSSSGTIKGKIKCNPLSNPNAAIKPGAAVYVTGFRQTPTSQPIFQTMVTAGNEYIFDSNVPKGQSVTYYFALAAMNFMPVEISFSN